MSSMDEDKRYDEFYDAEGIFRRAIDHLIPRTTPIEYSNIRIKIESHLSQIALLCNIEEPEIIEPDTNKP